MSLRISGTGKLAAEAVSFARKLGVSADPARDPDFKGLVERRNGFSETSFLPGRTFTSPFDLLAQLTAQLGERVNTLRES